MSIGSDSRYRLAPVLRDIATGETFVGTRLPVSLPVASDDRFVKPRAGERPDAFAYRLWGSAFGDAAAKLWWLVFDVNDVVNPLEPLDPDRAYRVPSAERIALEVLG